MQADTIKNLPSASLTMTYEKYRAKFQQKPEVLVKNPKNMPKIKSTKYFVEITQKAENYFEVW